MADKGITGYSVSEWEKMEQQITTLKAQLKRHGGHTAGCSLTLSIGERMQYPCDCGWVEIEKGLG